MEEFLEVIETKSSDELVLCVPYWCTQYNKLSLDFDHRVCELAQKVHEKLVKNVGRSFAPHLKSVIGTWVSVMNDSYPTIATAAKSAFQVTRILHANC